MLFFIAVQPVFPEISVRLIGETRISPEDDSVLRHGLLIANENAEPVRGKLELDLPRGIRALLLPGKIELEAYSEKLILFAVQVSDFAPAGMLEYGYSFISDAGAHTWGTGRITVEVSELPEIGLEIMKSPAFIVAGDSYDAGLRIENRGNVPLNISLKARSSDGSSVIFTDFPEKAVFLHPGEITEGRMVVSTQNDIGRPVNDRLELIAFSPEYGIEAEDSVSVELISPVSTGIDSFYRYYLHTSARTKLEFDDHSGDNPLLAVDAFAFGFLDEEKKHNYNLSVGKRIDINEVSFNHPDTLSDPADRLSLEYSGPFGRLGAGDLSRSITPLLKADEFGRGIDAEVNIGPVFFGGQYQLTGSGQTSSTSAAGFLGASSDAVSGKGLPLYSARASYFTDLSMPGAISLLQHVRSLNDDYFSLELASGIETFEHIGKTSFSLDNTAVGGEAELTFPGLKFAGSGSLSGAEFSGANPDSWNLNGNLDVRPFGPEFYVKSNVAAVMINNAEASAERSGLEVFEVSAGAGVVFPQFDAGGIYQHRIYKRNEGSDETLVVYDGGRIDLGLKFDAVSLDLRSELGRNFRGADNFPGLAQEHSLTVNFEMDRLSALFEAAYLQEMYAPDTPVNQINLKTAGSFNTGFIFVHGSIGLSAADIGFSDLTVLSKLSISLLPDTGSWFEFSAAHTAGGLNSESTDINDFSLSLSFSQRFDIKGGRREEYGSLEGSVVDQQNRPAGGIVVRLEDYAAVTDADGIFRFPALITGSYSLEIESGSLDTSVRPAQEMPLRIDIESKETETVRIALIDSARMGGRITEYSYRSPAAAVKSIYDSDTNADEAYRSEPFGYQDVFLTNGSISLWTVTDSRGSFAFDNLLPGRWRCSVPVSAAEQTLLRYSSSEYLERIRSGNPLIDEKVISIDLEAGEEAELDLNLFPPVPTVHILR
ncbi:MAG: carboxypeptidase regulatory-like domain-containing protein [Spirochaetales bacterium]|nr:carboxypeptidase regulatory-like domain-containing protein [Spirochaetales bacterium]